MTRQWKSVLWPLHGSSSRAVGDNKHDPRSVTSIENGLSHLSLGHISFLSGQCKDGHREGDVRTRLYICALSLHYYAVHFRRAEAIRVQEL